MTKRIFITLITLCFISINLIAQQSNLKFSNTNTFVGRIEENKLPAEINFIYTNKGTTDIKIVAIKLSVGCSVSNWNKNKAIPAGKGGALVFSYNPKHIGSFNEKIVITTDEKVNNEITLTFGGEIIARKRTHADLFNYKNGSLKFSAQTLNLGQIMNSKKKTDTLFVINNTQHKVTMESSYLNPPYITLECYPNVLLPLKEGFVIVKYDAAMRQDYGIMKDTLYLLTNDDPDSIKRINVRAEILEDFTKIKPEKRRLSPKAYLENTNYDFQMVTQGTAVKQSFNIINRGKTELVIRKVDCSCDCIEVSYPQKIRFSKEGVFNMVMNTSKKKGSVSETITIITNDPDNPKIVMHITGLVD